MPQQEQQVGTVEGCLGQEGFRGLAERLVVLLQRLAQGRAGRQEAPQPGRERLIIGPIGIGSQVQGQVFGQRDQPGRQGVERHAAGCSPCQHLEILRWSACAAS